MEGFLPPQGEEYIRQNGLYGLDPGKYVYDIGGYVAQMKTLLKDSRRIHSLYVAKQAVRLAKRWGENETYALVAGLLHDIQKNVPGDEQLQRIVNSDIIFEKTLPQQPKLWHAAAGAIYLRDALNIHNLQILNAVRYHTTGRANMTRLEQIVYLADLTSKDRTYGGVEKMRDLADTSLDDAMREAMEFIMGDLLQKKALIDRLHYPGHLDWVWHLFLLCFLPLYGPAAEALRRFGGSPSLCAAIRRLGVCQHPVYHACRLPQQRGPRRIRCKGSLQLIRPFCTSAPPMPVPYTRLRKSGWPLAAP